MNTAHTKRLERFTRFAIIAALAAGMSASLQAQDSYLMQQVPAFSAPYESDILNPRPVRYFIGLGLGAYAFQHLGDFSPSCDCLFSGEKGTRFYIALQFSIQYPRLGFALRSTASYYDGSAVFTQQVRRESIIVGEPTPVFLDYEKLSNVQLRYISFEQSAAYFIPMTQWFFFGGVSVGFHLDADYDHVEKILTSGYTYHDGVNTSTLLAKSEIPGGKNLRIALGLGTGFDFVLSSKFTLTPEIGFNFPLTPISTQDTDWRLMTEYGVLFIKYRL